MAYHSVVLGRCCRDDLSAYVAWAQTIYVTDLYGTKLAPTEDQNFFRFINCILCHSLLRTFAVLRLR